MIWSSGGPDVAHMLVGSLTLFSWFSVGTAWCAFSLGGFAAVPSWLSVAWSECSEHLAWVQQWFSCSSVVCSLIAYGAALARCPFSFGSGVWIECIGFRRGVVVVQIWFRVSWPE